MQRPPANIVGLSDRLRGSLNVRTVEKSVGARTLQRNDLRIDRRIGYLIGLFGYDQLGSLIAKTILEAFQVILAEVIVLVQHPDLGVGPGLQDIFGVNLGLGLIGWLPTHGP